MAQALRKVAEFRATDDSGKRAVVRRNAEWGEFVVAFVAPGRRNPAGTYHTDDRADAMSTARHFCGLPREGV